MKITDFSNRWEKNSFDQVSALSSLIICIFNQADTGKKENSAQNQRNDNQSGALTSGSATLAKRTAARISPITPNTDRMIPNMRFSILTCLGWRCKSGATGFASATFLCIFGWHGYNQTMTPLVQKLQMKPGKNWLIYNPPAGYLTSLKPLPEGATCTSKPTGNFDGIQLFANNKAQLSSDLHIIIPLLRPDTIFWIAYPKKEFRHRQRHEDGTLG